MAETNRYDISYGKARVPVYRIYARPLVGITPIPESSFTGRENTLFALEVDVEVFGDNFLSSYTEGDNTSVVATDSMKNFVLRQALAYQGATIEGFLDLLGNSFLDTYAQMERLRLTGRALPFSPAPVPLDTDVSRTPGTFASSTVLFSRSHDDYATAVLEFARAANGPTLTAHRCGLVGMQLLKVTGSSFTHFVRDSYTTLPERVDRPLFIYLDVFWNYGDATAMLAADASQYVAAEQVRDLIGVVFHQFVSESIQHLVHEMGQRMLARFPQISEVTFQAQNHTPDPAGVSPEDERVKVYTDPFSAYGLIQLTIRRGE